MNDYLTGLTGLTEKIGQQAQQLGTWNEKLGTWNEELGTNFQGVSKCARFTV